MARTGLYLSEVRKARDALLSQGRRPSVDAVRVELGNTGSKTTIHKYLKELEAEDGGAGGRKTSISEELQDLVERLAGRLQAEADERTAAIESQSADRERRDAESMAALHRELERARGELRTLAAEVAAGKQSHEQTRGRLHTETVARHTAEQQVSDLKERLLENEAHRQSLEEKHVHARDALEHYRQSVKEQRDQDQRRHEQQVQQLQAELRQLQQSLVVKLEEVTMLNQEGAKLVSDLSHARQALFDQQSIGRQQEKRVEGLLVEERRAVALEVQLADKAAQGQALAVRLDAATVQIGELTGQVRDLEISQASAQSALAAQQGIMAELRTLLAGKAQKELSPAATAP
ncbi:MAG: DNA-binding protein [Telluria sp.]